MLPVVSMTNCRSWIPYLDDFIKYTSAPVAAHTQ
ncbi:hypothetical protein GCK32_022631, partial [Trichostrongylus colubriformis]